MKQEVLMERGVDIVALICTIQLHSVGAMRKHYKRIYVQLYVQWYTHYLYARTFSSGIREL
jgi:hypothetical protein